MRQETLPPLPVQDQVVDGKKLEDALKMIITTPELIPETQRPHLRHLTAEIPQKGVDSSNKHGRVVSWHNLLTRDNISTPLPPEIEAHIVNTHNFYSVNDLLGDGYKIKITDPRIQAAIEKYRNIALSEYGKEVGTSDDSMATTKGNSHSSPDKPASRNKTKAPTTASKYTPRDSTATHADSPEEDTNYSDQQLFPGYTFETDHLSSLLGFQQPTTPSGKHGLMDSIDHPPGPTDLIQQMSPTQIQNFEQNVIKKYKKGTRFSKFKGKEEMVEMKQRNVKRRGLEQLRHVLSMKRNEKDTLKTLLAENKKLYEDSISQLVSLMHSVRAHLQANMPGFMKNIKLTSKQDYMDMSILSKYSLDEILPIPKELLQYRFPINKLLILDPFFKSAHSELHRLLDNLSKSAEKVPQIKQDMELVQYEIDNIETQQERLKKVEKQVMEEDLVENTELLVLEQLMKKDDEERRERLEQMHHKKQLLALEKERKKALRERLLAKTLKEKRGIFKLRFLHTLNEQKAIQEAKRIAQETEAKRQNEAMTSLQNNVKYIRNVMQTKPNQEPVVKNHENKTSSRVQVSEGRKMEIVKRILDEIEMKPDEKIALGVLEQRQVKHRDNDNDPNKPKMVPPPTVQELVERFGVDIVDIRQKIGKPLPKPNFALNIKSEKDQLLKSAHPYDAVPAQVLFQDYDTGVEYRQTITLTNISSCVNTFRLLPIDPELEEFFEIEFKPPGRMSAGTTIEMAVRFKAPTGFTGDLSGFIRLDCEVGGVYTIPFGCRERKCVPHIASVVGKGFSVVSFSPSTKEYPQKSVKNAFSEMFMFKKVSEKLSPNHVLINFGVTVNGGVSKRRLVLENLGALESCYSIVPYVGSRDTVVSGMSRSVRSAHSFINRVDSRFTVKATNGVLQPRESSSVVIEFDPTIRMEEVDDSDGKLELSNIRMSGFKVEFERSELEPIYISCYAKHEEAPMKTDKNEVDFGICLDEALYKQEAFLFNQGNTALKFHVEVDEGLLSSDMQGQHYDESLSLTGAMVMTFPSFGQLEVLPKAGVVQPNDPFRIRLKLKAQLDDKEGTTEIPFLLPLNIKYATAGAHCVLSLTLKGSVTTNRITIDMESDALKAILSGDEKKVNFGKCSVLDNIKYQVKVTNHSSLAQLAQFTCSHSALSFKPEGLEVITSKQSTKKRDNGTKVRLAPSSSNTFWLQFEPSTAGPLEMQLNCTCARKPKFTVSCLGEGFVPSVQFDQNNVSFLPASLGSFSTVKAVLKHHVTIVNRPDILPWLTKPVNPILSDKDAFEMEYEFQDPILVGSESIESKIADSLTYSYALEDPIPIHIWPRKGHLKPSDKTSINVTLCPPMMIAGMRKAALERMEKIDMIKKQRALIFEEIARREAEKKEKELAATQTEKNAKKKPAGKPEKVKEVAAAVEVPPVDIENIPLEPEKNPDVALDKLFESYRGQTLTLLIPCIVRKQMSQLSRSKLLIESNNEEMENQRKISIRDTFKIYLKVVAPIVCPEFLIESVSPLQSPNTVSTHQEMGSSLSKDSPVQASHHESILSVQPKEMDVSKFLEGLTSTKLDFERVPVGQQLAMSVTIRNISQKPILLQSSILNPLGPFYMAKSLREIPPKEASVIKISFEPRQMKSNSSVLHLSYGASQVNIKLAGDGVQPSVLVEPLSSKVYLPDTLVGETSSTSFKIHNPCHYPIRIQLDSESIQKSLKMAEKISDKEPEMQNNQAAGRKSVAVNKEPQTAAHRDVSEDGPIFSVSPTEFVLQPGNRQEVMVTFSPQRESDTFMEKLNINFWGQQKEFSVSLFGRGWETSTAVGGYEPAYKNEFYVVQKSGTDLVRAHSAASHPRGKSASSNHEDSTKHNQSDPHGVHARHKVETRYVTMTGEWKLQDKGPSLMDVTTAQEPNSRTWQLELKDLFIMNLKPQGKMDNAKGKGGSSQFTIERIVGGFTIDEKTGHFILNSTDFDQPLSAETLTSPYIEVDSSSGNMDLGASKPIKFNLIVPEDTKESVDNTQAVPPVDEGSKSKKPPPDNKKKPVPKSASLKRNDPVKDIPIASVKQPIHIEYYFKISLKGGYRVTDPKGAPNANEKRDWIVKVVANPDLIL